MQVLRPGSAWVAVAALVLVAPAAARADDIVDGIAAQVGGDIVLVSEVMAQSAPVEKKIRAADLPDSEIIRMRAEILNRLIETRLIEQAIRRAEIEATDQEVDAAIAAIASDNGITPERLRQSVVAQGLSFEAYRKRIKGEIERQMLISAAVGSRVKIEDAELKALYKKRYADQPAGGSEMHLRHLLIPFTSDDPASKDAVCAVATSELARIDSGEQFEAVASDVSVVNPQRGGDIGWIHTDSAAKWMKNSVENLEPGQHTGVVRTGFGCNILELVERRTFKRAEFKDVANQIYRELFDQRMAEEYQSFIEKLRSQTYVERKGMFKDTASLTRAPEDSDPTEWSLP